MKVPKSKNVMLFCNVFYLKAVKPKTNSTSKNKFDMKSIKYRFTQNIFKITIFSIIFTNLFAQNQNPAQDPTTPTNPNTVPTTLPNNLPTNYPNNTPATNIPNRNRALTNDPNAQRNVKLAPADQAAVNVEDSIRIARENDLKKDAAREAIRRRVFGYDIFNKIKFDPTPALNIPTPSNYVLGPNDQLLIDLYGFSQTNFKPVVSPDGYITLERAGLVYVSGLTVEQAKEKIVSQLSKVYLGLKSFNGYPANTFCNISLGNIRSIKVTILGEVVAPGTYTLPSLSTAMNALYACGGPNEIGTYRKIEIIRNNRVAAVLDLYDLLMNGTAKFNILLHDQDIIQVGPFVSRVAIQGQTKRNGLFELINGEKLDQAIHYAGGFNQYAYTQLLKIHRNTPRERKILEVGEKDLKTFGISSGDSIVIERVLPRYENMVTIEGAIFRPGEYSLDTNPSLVQLIKSAEGLKGDALKGRITILRTREDLNTELISVNLNDIYTGKTTDIPLKREDVIVIPSIYDLTEVSYVRIQGAINNPDAQAGIEVPFARNMSIEDLIVKVGGLSESASLSRIEVVRRKRNVDPTAANAQISDRFNFEVSPDLKVNTGSKSFFLEPYDEVFVRTSPNYVKQTFVEIQGEVFYPSIYGISSKDEKISDIIKRAGGITPQAYLEGATLIRKIQLSPTEIEQRRRAINEIANSQKANQAIEIEDIDETKSESIGINLNKILENPTGFEDMILQDGDVIRIPKRLETVRIQGEVLYPTTIKYFESGKFLNYISKSGGFTKRSLKSKSYVLYANGSVDRTRRFVFFNVYPKVAPGSEIIVPQRTVTGTQQLTQLSNIMGVVASTLGTVVTIIGILRITK